MDGEYLPTAQMPLHANFNNNAGFISWLRHPQRGLPYLICSILIILILLPFLIHYYLSTVILNEQTEVNTVRGNLPSRITIFGSVKTSEMKLQIDELRAIRLSVSNELLELEKKRQSQLADIAGYTTAIEGLKQSYLATSEELNRLKVSLTNLQVCMCILVDGTRVWWQVILIAHFVTDVHACVSLP